VLRARLDQQPLLTELLVLDAAGHVLTSTAGDRAERSGARLEPVATGLVAHAPAQPVPTLVVAVARRAPA
jgi:hypothetical protein